MDEPMTPHPGDELVDLALGHVDGRRRAELAAHLLECPSCRQEYDELSRAVSDATTQVPPVQPPVGFDAQVLRTIAEATPAATDARPALAAAAGSRSPPPSSCWPAGRRRRARASAAAAATSSPLSCRCASTTATPSAPCRCREVDGEPVMVVALTDAPADVSYTCRMRLSDGTVVESEPWPAVPHGAWIVDVPAGAADVEQVELVVSGTDHVWSLGQRLSSSPASPARP